MAMATKTIPEYLEDERRNSADTQLRTEEEDARIQSLLKVEDGGLGQSVSQTVKPGGL